MSAGTKTVVDVAVVGGGPVGSSAALGLQAAGFSTLLIERGPPPAAFDASQHDARVYAIAPPSAALLTRLGVWPAIHAARVSPYRRMRVWSRVAERGLCFDAADRGLAALGWIVEHGLITACAHAVAEAVALPQRFGVQARLQSLPEPGDDAPAELQLDNGETVQARLIVAADGADSPLRAAVGIDTVGWAYRQRAIVAEVEASAAETATAFQRFLPTGPLAFLPLANGRHSIVWSVVAPEAERLLALDADAFADALAEASQHALGELRLLGPRRAVPLRLLHAASYHRPGLVLVGDAAHAIHPLAGQGANLGFADVAALIDTLVLARDAGRDGAGPRVLDVWARQRKAANLEMLALTDSLQRGFSAPALGAAMGLGLEWVQRIPPLKSFLAGQAG